MNPFDDLDFKNAIDKKDLSKMQIPLQKGLSESTLIEGVRKCIDVFKEGLPIILKAVDENLINSYHDGITFFHYAILKGRLEAARTLVDFGADSNQAPESEKLRDLIELVREDGWTPLSWDEIAVLREYEKIIKDPMEGVASPPPRKRI